jgi:hypothetical protein
MNDKLLIKELYFLMCLRLQIVEMKEHMGRGLVDERNCCWWPSTTKTYLHRWGAMVQVPGAIHNIHTAAGPA